MNKLYLSITHSYNHFFDQLLAIVMCRHKSTKSLSQKYHAAVSGGVDVTMVTSVEEHVLDLTQSSVVGPATLQWRNWEWPQEIEYQTQTDSPVTCLTYMYNYAGKGV